MSHPAQRIKKAPLWGFIYVSSIEQTFQRYRVYRLQHSKRLDDAAVCKRDIDQCRRYENR